MTFSPKDFSRFHKRHACSSYERMADLPLRNRYVAEDRLLDFSRFHNRHACYEKMADLSLGNRYVGQDRLLAFDGLGAEFKSSKEKSYYFGAELEQYKNEIKILKREVEMKSIQIHNYKNEVISYQENIRVLESKNDAIQFKMKWQEEMIRNRILSNENELKKCMKEKECRFELEGQLNYALMTMKKNEDELREERAKSDRQLYAQNRIMHYPEENVELNHLRTQLREALTKLKERESELNETYFAKSELERKVENCGIIISQLEEAIDSTTVSSQKHRIKQFERGLECRDLEHLELLHNKKQVDLERDKLSKDLKKKDGIISELRYERQHTLDKLKETEEKLNSFKAERHINQHSKQGIEEEKEQTLEGEVEKHDQKFKNLDKMLDIRNIEAENKRKLIQDQLSRQKNELQRALIKLHETTDKLNETTSERDIERLARQKFAREANENHTKFKELERIVTSQNKKMKTLQREVEQRDLQLKDLDDNLNLIKNEAANEREITSDLKKQEEQLSEKRHRLKLTEAKLDKITYERDIEQQTRQELERQAKENQTRIKELEQANYKVVMSQKKKDDQLSEQRNQLQQALIKLKQVEATLDETKSERDLERHTRLDLEDKAKTNHRRIQEQAQVNDKIVTPQKQRIQDFEEELKRRDLKVKELEDMLEKTKAEVGSEKKLGHVLRKREDQLAELERQLKTVLVKLKETETELEETKTRLSKAMGDRLTDNNPNIADLSDKNRPVKLAERYAELYDNQWTDAFDILGEYFDGEQNTIEALLEVLQDVMHFCLASRSQQMEDLQSVLGFSKANIEDVPVDVRKHLKDCRKAMSSIATRNLYEMYISHLRQTDSQKSGRAMEIRSYVQECLEICWLMVIQDPPVVFAPVGKSGSALNTDIYKPYTSSGTYVEFTVWPALLLHEGGPVLAKGVAQGYGKKLGSSKK